MRHDINTIARNYHLDRNRFRDFAQLNQSKYGIDIDNGFMTTSTWYTNDLVADFKAVDQKDRFLEGEDVDGMTVLGWKADLDTMSGSLGWFNPKTDAIIYATPNWENEDGKTPFEVTYPDGRYEIKLVLHLSKDNSIDQQRAFYIAVLKTVIESL
jgi:hypothetical protein